MGKTNELRKLVTSMLRTVCDNVYYEQAFDDSVYPRILFDFISMDLGDLSRDDIMIDIEIYDKPENIDATGIENLADKIEQLFRTVNAPQENLLPTFYVESRQKIEETDKKYKHRNISVYVQNYEK